MCGIAGIIGGVGADVPEHIVRRMNRAHVRRGPNDEGVASWVGATLGHRRLSVFDVSDAGHQPMLSQDGSVGIVFNGSIYNFRELMRELQAEGCQFRSKTDTEVLLAGYCHWGLAGLLVRIRGMFAFALWDSNKRLVMLVRDPLGVKPLLYGEIQGQLYFASSAEALRLAGIASDLDPTAVAEFLEFGYVTEKRSIYRGFQRVPAATVIEWQPGKIHSWTYWVPRRPSYFNPTGRMGFSEAVEEAERLLLQAVDRRLFADVPIAALLSGGIDSALVCWAIKELGRDVTAYTVGASGDPLDESVAARATAQRLGISHKIIEAQSHDLAVFNNQIMAFGEPFACASALGMLKVSEAIRNDATVVLTGDGGDDAFLGYPEHRHLWWAQQLAEWLPESTFEIWKRTRNAVPDFGSARRIKHFADYAIAGLGGVTRAHEGLPALRADGMLGPRLMDVRLASREVPWLPNGGRTVLTDFLEYDLNNRFVCEYLRKVDGSTMFYGLEARSPFLDTDLWEFASLLQFSTRLNGNVQKAVLREVARKRIGPEVAGGPKRGFAVPVYRWLTSTWRPVVREAFCSSVLHDEGWVNADALVRRLDSCPAGESAPIRLWYSYVLESWYRHHRGIGCDLTPTVRSN